MADLSGDNPEAFNRLNGGEGIFRQRAQAEGILPRGMIADSARLDLCRRVLVIHFYSLATINLNHGIFASTFRNLCKALLAKPLYAVSNINTFFSKKQI